MINYKSKKNKGFLVLTMVLLVSAVVLIVAAGMFLRSIGEVSESSDAEMSLKAIAAADACGDYALGQLSASSTGWSYGGDEELEVEGSGVTCYIYSIETSGTSQLIKASSVVSGFTRKILIEVATNTPSIIVNSWITVADFE